MQTLKQGKTPRAERAIIEAAQGLIIEQGFSAMSMRHLGKRVGLHAASLYHYFPGKQDVLEEVLEGLLEQRLQGWWQCKPRHRPVAQRLEAFITYHLQHAGDAQLLRAELRHLEPPRRSRLEQQDAAYSRELSELLSEGAAVARWQVGDVQLTTCSLLAMYGGALVHRQGSSESFIEQLIQMTRRLLQVPPLS